MFNVVAISELKFSVLSSLCSLFPRFCSVIYLSCYSRRVGHAFPRWRSKTNDELNLTY